MKIMAIISSILIGVHSTFFAVAVPMPILPYIPPESVEIMDIISEMYGVTAPAIEDKQDRMGAYMDLYQRALGAGWQSFWDSMKSAIDGVKTGGDLIITPTMSTDIQTALYMALQSGYTTGESEPMTSFEELKTSIIEDFSVTDNDIKSYQWEQISNSLSQKFGALAYTASVFRYQSGSSSYLHIVFYPSSMRMQRVYNGSYNGVSYNVALFPSGTPQIYTNVLATTKYNNAIYNFIVNTNMNYYYTTGFTQNEIVKYKDYGSVAQVVSVMAQSGIESALETQSVIPLTADTDITETAGDIVIKKPVATTYPATSLDDLDEKQGQLGVKPVTPTATTQEKEQIVEQLKQEQIAKYGSVEDYSLNLTDYFPFCIPFDIGNLLTLFVAEPEAPQIEIALPVAYNPQDGFEIETYTLDLSQFDAVALWCRRGMLLVFIVGLGMVTRKVFLRG